MTEEHNGDHDDDAPHNPGEPKFDPAETDSEEGSDVAEVESGETGAGSSSEEADRAQEREGEAAEG